MTVSFVVKSTAGKLSLSLSKSRSMSLLLESLSKYEQLCWLKDLVGGVEGVATGGGVEGVATGGGVEDEATGGGVEGVVTGGDPLWS